ncbi:MAG: hypothetical protein AVDCRST_MAG08-628, partial [uncultured Acetobacteraceae bacterium]
DPRHAPHRNPARPPLGLPRRRAGGRRHRHLAAVLRHGPHDGPRRLPDAARAAGGAQRAGAPRPRFGSGGARRPAGARRHGAQPDAGGRGARAAGGVGRGAAPLPAQPLLRHALRPGRPFLGLRPTQRGFGAGRGGTAGGRTRAGPDAGLGRYERRAGGTAARPHRRGARPLPPGSASRVVGTGRAAGVRRAGPAPAPVPHVGPV